MGYNTFDMELSQHITRENGWKLLMLSVLISGYTLGLTEMGREVSDQIKAVGKTVCQNEYAQHIFPSCDVVEDFENQK
jgi:hypothetical protein